jgi:hypothetical protein
MRDESCRRVRRQITVRWGQLTVGPWESLSAASVVRRLLENPNGEKTIQLHVQAVDGRNNPIPDLKWSCDRARLEIEDKDEGK